MDCRDNVTIPCSSLPAILQFILTITSSVTAMFFFSMFLKFFIKLSPYFSTHSNMGFEGF